MTLKRRNAPKLSLQETSMDYYNYHQDHHMRSTIITTNPKTTKITRTTIMRSTTKTTKTSNWLYFRQEASMTNTKIHKKNNIKTSTNQPVTQSPAPINLIFYLQATSMNCRLWRALCSCWRWRRNFGCNAFVLITIIFFIIMLMAKKCLIFYGLCTISPPGPCYQSR